MKGSAEIGADVLLEAPNHFAEDFVPLVFRFLQRAVAVLAAEAGRNAAMAPLENAETIQDVAGEIVAKVVNLRFIVTLAVLLFHALVHAIPPWFIDTRHARRVI